MDLSTKTREELVEIAEKLGIKVHHKAKPETIIMQINQQPQAHKDAAMEEVHPLNKPQAPVHENSKEQVLKAIERYMAKDGFEAIFDDEDNTVTLRYKGAEDCCNLSIPLRIIKQKAEIVSIGRRAPRSMGRDNTYPNSYADNILV